MALTDDAGRILEAYQYDAYGYQTVISPGASGSVVFGPADVVTPGGDSELDNPFLFTGQRLDPETGLYDDRAREYNPAQGRFLSRDPLGPENGPDLYQYVNDNPADGTDPTGCDVFAGNDRDKEAFLKAWKEFGGEPPEVTPIRDGRYQISAGGNTDRKIERMQENLPRGLNPKWLSLVRRAFKSKLEWNLDVDKCGAVSENDSLRPDIPDVLPGEWTVSLCADSIHAWIRYTKGNEEFTIGNIIGTREIDWNTDLRRSGSCISMTVQNPAIIKQVATLGHCALYAGTAYPAITGQRHLLFDPNYLQAISYPGFLALYLWAKRTVGLE
jgi:RHS repeat-associated protein